MNKLQTRIGSLTLPNPVICGSGEPVMTAAGIAAALKAGVAGVVAKSINETEAAAKQLDIADYVLLGPDQKVQEWSSAKASESSLLCRSGLAQMDPDEWLKIVGEADASARASGQFVAASIVFGELDGALEIARKARRAGIRIFELNMGSPLSYEATPGTITSITETRLMTDTVAQVKEAFGGIVWAKLTGLSNNLPDLAAAARRGGAESVGMAGRLMGFLPDIETHRPILDTAAGYGGPWALPIACRWVALAHRKLGPEFPLIGTNGARSGLDVVRLVLSGASAVELTSLVMQKGFGALAQAIADIDAYLQRKNATVAQLIGKSAMQMQTYAYRAEHHSQPGHWKKFVPAGVLDNEALAASGNADAGR